MLAAHHRKGLEDTDMTELAEPLRVAKKIGNPWEWMALIHSCGSTANHYCIYSSYTFFTSDEKLERHHLTGKELN